MYPWLLVVTGLARAFSVPQAVVRGDDDRTPFEIVGSSGVPAMHAALMPNGKVVFLDKVEDYTELKLPNGQLAYSSEYDPVSRSLTPLSYATNAFCCGGTFLADGRLISVGGNGPLEFIDPTVTDGFDAIRYLERHPGGPSNSWEEPGNKLASKRWYASAQILADGTVFVASGSLNGLDPTKFENNNPTYEVLDRNGMSNGVSVPMDLLVRTQPYYMYPFVHLLSDGHLFVFSDRSSQIFSVPKNQAIRKLPDLEGLHRTYPNTGGSVLLPLSSAENYEPAIMICGGGAFQDLASPTEGSCGTIKPLSEAPTWETTIMPGGPRTMVEGTLLPDGTVLWLNGAREGAEGFGIADDPALDALIYDPKTSSWITVGTSVVPRLYHSVALLLPDGSVLVAGSNPNEMPVRPENVDVNVAAKKYPTEFRIEIYAPPYLADASKRPKDVWLDVSEPLKADGMEFEVKFAMEMAGSGDVKVAILHGGFATHALHMGQRMVYLDFDGFDAGKDAQILKVKMPAPRIKSGGSAICPPGPYMLFVVVDGVPGEGRFVMVE